MIWAGQERETEFKEVKEGAEVKLVVDGDEEEGNDVIDEGGIIPPVKDMAAQNQEDDFVYEPGWRGHQKRGLHGATVVGSYDDHLLAHI